MSSHCRHDDLVYFNLKIDNIFNNVPFTQGYGSPVAKQAQIQLKTGQILECQSDYLFAIDFFNLSGRNLPICYVDILEGDNDDINATQYGFCLTHTGSGDNYARRVEYYVDLSPGAIAYGILPKPPLDNNGLTDYVSSPQYYAVYTIAKMLHMFNVALYRCWAAMVADHPADSPSCPPYLYHNEQNNRVVLIIHQEYVHSPLAQMFWNTQTERYIESMHLEVQREYFTGDQLTFKEFKLVPDLARPYESGADAYGLPPMSDILNPPAAGDIDFLPWKDVGNTEFYVMMQEYDSLYFWNNIASIVFFSNSISVRDEYLPVSVNPNLINSHRVQNMTIGSPTVVTTSKLHNFREGQTVYVSHGSYSVGGVPVTATSEYVATNVTPFTLELYTTAGLPVNVTAWNPAVDMWIYAKLNGQIGLFNNPTRSILAYFDIIPQRGVDWRENLTRLPNYRKYHNLTSDSPLNEIDIDIYLQLTNGSLVPYYLAINESLDIKLVFKRQ